eukprot:CAMPEP_0171102416 /NCGR_PEP_ID=MMETSP0766_2-20121228/57777_1 /TAXON_ID=439317 /ORGANISM="Gambierdiscus australes, Strain CAWD 149" /LENGTH=75 /DNA_ID=CAMNT_0011562709 /DNA_START=15 /DNA_END=239 /DNA_ORIENTATION=-
MAHQTNHCSTSPTPQDPRCARASSRFMARHCAAAKHAARVHQLKALNPNWQHLALAAGGWHCGLAVSASKLRVDG